MELFQQMKEAALLPPVTIQEKSKISREKLISLCKLPQFRCCDSSLILCGSFLFLPFHIGCESTFSKPKLLLSFVRLLTGICHATLQPVYNVGRPRLSRCFQTRNCHPVESLHYISSQFYKSLSFFLLGGGVGRRGGRGAVGERFFPCILVTLISN